MKLRMGIVNGGGFVGTADDWFAAARRVGTLSYMPMLSAPISSPVSEYTFLRDRPAVRLHADGSPVPAPAKKVELPYPRITFYRRKKYLARVLLYLQRDMALRDEITKDRRGKLTRKRYARLHLRIQRLNNRVIKLNKDFRDMQDTYDSYYCRYQLGHIRIAQIKNRKLLGNR